MQTDLLEKGSRKASIIPQEVLNMELTTILVADYASIDQSGKINLMGIFQSINCQTFPTRHPSMHLFVKLSAELGEYGEERNLTISMRDENGKEIFKMNGPIKIPQPQGGRRPEVNAIFQIKDVVFNKPGRFQFVVLVDKDHKGQLSFDVTSIGLLAAPPQKQEPLN